MLHPGLWCPIRIGTWSADIQRGYALMVLYVLLFTVIIHTDVSVTSINISLTVWNFESGVNFTLWDFKHMGKFYVRTNNKHRDGQ